MARWVTSTILVVTAVVIRSASGSPTTRPDVPSKIVAIRVDDPYADLKSRLNSGQAGLQKIPDLSAYLSQPPAFRFNFTMPKELVIPQAGPQRFDPTAKLHIPESEMRDGFLNPSGPSYMFNGVRVYMEPCGFSARSMCTLGPTTPKMSQPPH